MKAPFIDRYISISSSFSTSFEIDGRLGQRWMDWTCSRRFLLRFEINDKLF